MYDDESIVKMVLSGNSDAYGEIVHRYKDVVFAVIYAIIKDYHTAEDLAQDTFIDGYIKLKSLGEPYNVGAWLVKIAKNKCYNHLTRSSLRFESELHEFIPDSRNATPENFLMAKYERHELRQALQRLPEIHKTVAVLYYFNNYSQNKIAEHLNIPVGTVKSRLYDARQKLKKELGNMEDSINFEKEIARRIKLLKDYYHVHNFSMDGIQTEVDKLIKFIDGIPESKLKHQAYITAYGWSDKEEYKTKREKEIEIYGGDPDAAQRYVHEFWDKYANKSSDEEWLKGIDGDEGLAKVEKMENSENAVGEMRFWRGACNIRLKNYAEAKKDFETAAEKLNCDNSYHPNAIAGIKAADLMGNEPDKYFISTSGVTGERYRLYDGGKRFDFLEQPGFSNSSSGTKKPVRLYLLFLRGNEKK